MERLGVEVVAFDVNETLFSLERLRPAFTEVGLDPGLVPLWFARVLRDGFALTAVGEFAAFADVAAETLRGLDPSGIDDAAVATVLGAFGELEPHPDAEPALVLLRNAGVRVVTLTNGSAELVGRLLVRAGLGRYVERSLSVDSVRRWKPAPQVYLYAAEATGVAPGQVALVAAHAWDCDGARRAGLRTGWVARSERRRPQFFLAPDVEGDELPDVAARLLDAPSEPL